MYKSFTVYIAKNLISTEMSQYLIDFIVFVPTNVFVPVRKEKKMHITVQSRVNF